MNIQIFFGEANFTKQLQTTNCKGFLIAQNVR